MTRLGWRALVDFGPICLVCLLFVSSVSAAGPNPRPRGAPRLQYISIWSSPGSDSDHPTVVYNPIHDEYLVVWEYWKPGAQCDIYARRVGSDGSLRGYTVIAPPSGQIGQIYEQPAVAYSPAQDAYLIVYTHRFSPTDFDLWARRVRWDLHQMSNEFTTTEWYRTDYQWFPAVAYNSQADEFLVVYENYWAGGLRDIAAQRIKASDLTAPSWRNIATGTGQLRVQPDVAYNSHRNQYLIAYTFIPSLSPGAKGDVFVRTVSATMGTVGTETAVCDNTETQGDIHLATGADEYMAIWTDDRLVDSNPFARRLSGAGTPSGAHCGAPVAPRFEAQGEPALAYVPRFGYLAMWRQGYGLNQGDIYGRYVPEQRDVSPGDRFGIHLNPLTQSAPAVACDGRDRCLAVEADQIVAGGTVALGGWLLTLRHAYLPTVRR